MHSPRSIGFLLIGTACVVSCFAHDTTYVSGAIQHDGLLSWSPVSYGSNSYLDLSVYYLNDSNNAHFHTLRATTRAEMTQWPLSGYDPDFAGHGISHLSVDASFDWGDITLGDVYGQFGSGLILNLYENRSLGIDGALRGAKLDITPYQGLHMTLLGGKQRRFWTCYHDKAWGWNYARDAIVGGDLELHIEQWSEQMRMQQMSLTLGGSYVSKYEAEDTIIVPINGDLYRYRFPRWVGAGELRVAWRMKGWELIAEYARKANDPCLENHFNYRAGDALWASLSYSQKGLAVLAQVKRSDNMSFRSERLRTGVVGRLNQLPAFTQQHTYALAALYPYATQYADGEWAFQTEIRYTWPRKTKMGGEYGTTLKLSAAHVRGLESDGAWTINTRAEGEYYTDVNIELNKRLAKNWWFNAMVMYQGYNQKVVEGEGGIIRSGIAVLDTRVQINSKVSMRAELQYLYSPHYEGQWIFALYELSLYKHLTLSGQWMYNIGFAPSAHNEHFYTFAATFSHSAHRLMVGYTKTQEGFQCDGGVCRYVPRQQGVTLSYSYLW